MDREEYEIEINKEDARQGTSENRIWKILVASTAITVAAFAVTAYIMA